MTDRIDLQPQQPTPTHTPYPTAPLPTETAALTRRLELRLASPVDRLYHQIGRLEESLYIQRQGRDADLAVMRNVALTDTERAAARGSARSTVREMRSIRRQLAALKTQAASAASYGTAAIHVVQLAELATATGTLTDLDADDLAHAEDLKAGAQAALAGAGRLDLIGASA